VNAYLNDVMEQLEGQIAAAKVAMVFERLPPIYLNSIDSGIATACSDKVATSRGIKDFSCFGKIMQDRQTQPNV